MTAKPAPASESFTTRYKPSFNEKRDEWVLRVPSGAVTRISNRFYEVRLPLYASRALAIGGNILRLRREKYRDWLLEKQGGICKKCLKGPKPNNPWNLDHQPPLSKPGSKFIDYERVTQNRVIHSKCDPAQTPKGHE